MAALGHRGVAQRSPLLLSRNAPSAGKRVVVVPRQPLGVAAKSAAVSEPVTAPAAVANAKPEWADLIRPSLLQSAASAPAPAPEHSPQPSSFVWERRWVPVCPLSYLDPSRPTPVMLLGQSLVVWRHTALGWVVMRDVCPHRLAPLSEGRLEAGGTRLACSYHGWEFSEAGKCTKVPQLAADPRAAATACSSPRSCVTSFPTLELDGLLFVWLDGSKEGMQEAQRAPKPDLMDERAASYFDWNMNELPSDYTFWLEQSMDPTHANFLHEGVSSFRCSNAMPLEGQLEDKKVDLLQGFLWQHGGYQVSNQGMKATREFEPPFLNRVSYAQPNGSLALFWIMSVPVRPGVARVYFKGGFGRAASPDPPPPSQQQEPQQLRQKDNGGDEAAAAPAPLSSASASSSNGKTSTAPKAAPPRSLFGQIMSRLPHWAINSQLLGDQDLIMMCRQEVIMRREGLTARQYNLNSKADGGVAATNVWLRQAGYPDSLWGGKPVIHSGLTYGNWPAQELPLEQILSRQERHVRHCAVCQKGLKQVTAVCTALTAAAGLAALAAVTLAIMAAISPAGAAAPVSWWAVAGAVVAAVALATAAVKGWSFREERFVSGAAQWRKLGGFALTGSKNK